MSETPGIQWGDPPPIEQAHPRTGQGRAQRFVRALKERPGEWGLYPSTLATSGVSEYRKAFPGTEWTTRKRDDGRFDIYARWVGDE